MKLALQPQAVDFGALLRTTLPPSCHYGVDFPYGYEITNNNSQIALPDEFLYVNVLASLITAEVNQLRPRCVSVDGNHRPSHFNAVLVPSLWFLFQFSTSLFNLRLKSVVFLPLKPENKLL